jgi:hypothetical protein
MAPGVPPLALAPGVHSSVVSSFFAADGDEDDYDAPDGGQCQGQPAAGVAPYPVALQSVPAVQPAMQLAAGAVEGQALHAPELPAGAAAVTVREAAPEGDALVGAAEELRLPVLGQSLQGPVLQMSRLFGTPSYLVERRAACVCAGNECKATKRPVGLGQ